MRVARRLRARTTDREHLARGRDEDRSRARLEGLDPLLAAPLRVKIERPPATVLESLVGRRLEDRPWKSVLPCDPDRKRIRPLCDGE